MNKILVVLCATLLLAGCGGGGSSLTASSGSSGSSGDSGSSGSGSGSSSGSGGSSTTTVSTCTQASESSDNMASVCVDAGPAVAQQANYLSVDTLFVTVTICLPGRTDSASCQTIDHVQVDTGSSGVRILAQALNSTMLSALKSAVTPSPGGSGILAECMQYVDGNVWGPIVNVDLHVGGANSATSGETASGLPVQVIDDGTDMGYAYPTGCTQQQSVDSSGNTTTTTVPLENTITSFGANGIIGLSSFLQDCDDSCALATTDAHFYPLYYACTSTSGSSCSPVSVPLDSQMINPISKFASDKVGVTVQLPTVPDAGQAIVYGTLTFNSAAPALANQLTLDPNLGEFITTLGSQTMTESYIDSGSNALYFNDVDSSGNAITACTASYDTGFLCPSSEQSLTAYQFSAGATDTGSGGIQVAFTVQNAGTLFNNNYSAYDNLGGPAGTGYTDTFDWGLPFFFGRTVYTSLQTSDTDNPVIYWQ